MGYRFVGFFAEGQAELLDAAKKRWTETRGRLISEPFEGIGVAAPELIHAEQEEIAHAYSVAETLRNELPEWSKNYPDITFVFIDADCFGGTCLYEGYVCRNGEFIEKVGDPFFEKASGDVEELLADSPAPVEPCEFLRRLVKYLSVDLPSDCFFAPFVRGYFGQHTK